MGTTHKQKLEVLSVLEKSNQPPKFNELPKSWAQSLCILFLDYGHISPKSCTPFEDSIEVDKEEYETADYETNPNICLLSKQEW